MLIVRRQWYVVAACVAVAVAIAVGYILTATPVYTSSAEVVVSGPDTSVISDIAGTTGEPVKDEDILTYIEIIRSDRIIGRALAKIEFDLSVHDRVAYASGEPGLFERFLSARASDGASETKGGGAASAAEQLVSVKDNVTARRVGRTNVISVSYDDTDPVRATALVKAIADSFVEDHAQKKVQSAETSSAWLQGRIEELRAKVLAADTAVQNFRAENALLETNGQLVSDQALGNVNKQLLDAEAATAQARAKYERVTDIIASGDTNAVIVDALDSSLITTLRKEYLEASKRQSEISAQLGPEHLQAVKLRAEMAEYSRLMFEELRRIEDSYKNELAVAQARENSLRQAVEQASGVTSQSNQVMVQLRELERESQVYRSIYESMLSRLQEVNQQAALPVVVAELVNEPQLPAGPSHPKKPLILGLAFLLGGAVGAAAGAMRELRDVSYKNGDLVKSDLRLRFLGYAPVIVGDMGTDLADRVRAGSDSRPHVVYTDHTGQFAVKHPLSQFAETIRSCRLATEKREGAAAGAVVVGIVSSLPGEGKTTISANYANSLASAGYKTLLVDADLRRPGLTQLAVRDATAGLHEVLRNEATLGEAVLTDPETGLLMLPSFAAKANPSDRNLDHRLIGPFLAKAREHFDYIVVDLPPLAPVIDARSIAPSVDQFLFVVEWGVTSRKVIKTLVEAEREVFSKCSGVLLNKTDLGRMKYYAYYGSVEYYRNTYNSYYVKN